MHIFDRAMVFVFIWEGGYSNDPNDPGGETNFGISKASYPNLDIANLTEDDARRIYERDYWNKIQGNRLHPRVAVTLMDFAVNSGVTTAVKALQEIVDVSKDGRLGPITLREANEASFRGLSLHLNLARVEHLVRINNQRFLVGWLRRVLSLASYVEDIY